MLDVNNNVTTDVVPYGNFQFLPLSSFDLSAMVPTIQGIGFDSRQQMWIWIGSYLVPFALECDGCLFDLASRALYFTQPYQAVRHYASRLFAAAKPLAAAP